MATYTNAPAVNSEVGNYYSVGGGGDQTLYTVPSQSYAVVGITVISGTCYVATSTVGGSYASGSYAISSGTVTSIHLGPGTRLIGATASSIYFWGVLFTNQA